MSEWYQSWFGEAYLELYPHRDEAEARRAVALLVREGAVKPGARILDLACGAGRHAVELAEQGARVTGLDLSAVLLKAARSRWAGPLVRADMRYLPLRSGSFDSVLNLFTSFGYFSSDEESAGVLRDVARVLAPGGWFALDFLNAPAVRARLVARDSKQVQGKRVVQERRLSNAGRTVVKVIHLEHEGKSFEERVRLFERDELERMLSDAGLRIEAALGDYDGGPHTAESPRLLLLARRA